MKAFAVHRHSQPEASGLRHAHQSAGADIRVRQSHVNDAQTPTAAARLPTHTPGGSSWALSEVRQRLYYSEERPSPSFSYGAAAHQGLRPGADLLYDSPPFGYYARPCYFPYPPYLPSPYHYYPFYQPWPHAPPAHFDTHHHGHVWPGGYSSKRPHQWTHETLRDDHDFHQRRSQALPRASTAHPTSGMESAVSRLSSSPDRATRAAAHFHPNVGQSDGESSGPASKRVRSTGSVASGSHEEAMLLFQESLNEACGDLSLAIQLLAQRLKKPTAIAPAPSAASGRAAGPRQGCKTTGPSVLTEPALVF
jgi:hypothetical protein